MGCTCTRKSRRRETRLLNFSSRICPPSMTMADESDGALDEEEAEDIMVSPKAPISSDVSLSLCGFRPDFNPAGFTYKRRESAALKKKTDRLAEMKEAS